jgi:hypothetical protein
LFIDKIRNRNGVATQMPLGAEPLDEADIVAIEDWIENGALRTPDADPAPALNNPPRRPEIAIFNNAGTRLDGTGPVRVAPGTTLVLRHSVQDFETPDNAIPFAALVLQLPDGQQVILNPASPDNPGLATTTLDTTNPPQGRGDLLNYEFTWTIPTDLPIVNPANGVRGQIGARNQDVTMLVLYIDGASPAIVAFDSSTTVIEIR